MNALKRKCEEKEDQLILLRKRAKELQDKKNSFNEEHAQQLIDINLFWFSMSSALYCSNV